MQSSNPSQETPKQTPQLYETINPFNSKTRTLWQDNPMLSTEDIERMEKAYLASPVPEWAGPHYPSHFQVKNWLHADKLTGCICHHSARRRGHPVPMDNKGTVLCDHNCISCREAYVVHGAIPCLHPRIVFYRSTVYARCTPMRVKYVEEPYPFKAEPRYSHKIPKWAYPVKTVHWRYPEYREYVTAHVRGKDVQVTIGYLDKMFPITEVLMEFMDKLFQYPSSSRRVDPEPQFKAQMNQTPRSSNPKTFVDEWCETEDKSIENYKELLTKDIKRERKLRKQKRGPLPLFTEIDNALAFPQPLKYDYPWIKRKIDTLTMLKKRKVLINVLSQFEFNPFTFVTYDQMDANLWSTLHCIIALLDGKVNLRPDHGKYRPYYIFYMKGNEGKIMSFDVPEDCKLPKLTYPELYKRLQSVTTHWRKFTVPIEHVDFEIRNSLERVMSNIPRFKAQGKNRPSQSSSSSCSSPESSSYNPLSDPELLKLRASSSSAREKEEAIEMIDFDLLEEDHVPDDLSKVDVLFPNKSEQNLIANHAPEIKAESKSSFWSWSNWNPFAKANDHVSAVRAEVTELVDDTKEKIDQLNMKASSLMDKINDKVEAIPDFKEMFEKISESFSGMFTMLNGLRLVAVIACCTTLTLYAVYGGTWAAPLIASALGAMLLFVDLIIEKRLDMKAQGVESTCNYMYEVFQRIARLICDIPEKMLTLSDYLRHISLDSVAKTSRNIKSIGDLFTNLPKYAEFLQDSFHWVRDKVYLWIFKHPYSFSACMAQPIIELAANVMEDPNYCSPNALLCLQKKTEMFMRDCCRGTVFNAMQAANHTFKSAYEIQQADMIVKSRNGVSPLVIKWWGEPNIGKSTIMSEFAAGLSKHYVGHNSVYYRNSADDFCSGYANQFIWCKDDFGAVSDTSSNPSKDFAELIALKNIAPYVLNMPHLEDKGNVVACSAMIFLSTNVKSWAIGTVNSLVCPKALERRFDICIDMVERDKFVVTKYMLNESYNKTFDTAGLLEFIMSAYEKHYADELAVARNLRDKVSKIIFDHQQKQDGYFLAADVYQSFVKWRAYVEGRDDTTEYQKKLLSKYRDVFNNISDGSTVEVLIDRLKTAQIKISPHNPEFRELMAYATKLKGSPGRKGGVNDFDPTVFTLDRDLFVSYGKTLLAAKKDPHPCPCKMSDTVKYHYDTSESEKKKTREDLLKTLQEMTEWAPEEVQTVKHLPFCPFQMCSDLKIPRNFLLQDASLPAAAKTLVLMSYECACAHNNQCTHQHRWLIPGFVNDKQYDYLAVWLGAQVTQFCKEKNIGDIVPPSSWRDKVAAWWNKGDNKPLLILGALGAIVVGAVTMIGVTKYVMREDFKAHSSSGLHAVRANQQQVPAWKGQFFNMKDGANDTTLAQFMKILLKHEAKCYFEEDHKDQIMSLLFLDGYNFLMMNHARLKIKPNDYLYIVFPHKAMTHKNFRVRMSELKTFQLSAFNGIDKADIVMCQVPPELYTPGLCDIRDRVLKRSEIDTVAGNPVLLSVLEDEGDGPMPIGYRMEKCTLNKERISYDVSVDGVTTSIVNNLSILYGYGGKEGICSAPVLSLRPRADNPRRIAGLHGAGCTVTGKGMADILTLEQILEADKALGYVTKYVPNMANSFRGNYAVGEEDIKHLFAPLESAPVDLAFEGDHVPGYRSTRSKICETEIKKRGNLPSKKSPAVLKPVIRDGVRVDPMYLGLKKVERPFHRVNRRALDLAAADLMQQLVTAEVDGPEMFRGVLTIEEAVFGIPGRPYIPALNASTSAGYPWKVDYPGKGKTRLIDFERRWIHPDLIAKVQKRIEMAKNGEALEAIFEDCLKDEKRPNEKVEALKTRIFSSGPLDLLIAMKMYFGGFVEWYMNSRIYNGGAVGINPTSAEWTHLVQWLIRFGRKNIIDGDYVTFDASLVREILYEAGNMINRKYGNQPEANKVRLVLLYVVIAALHMVDGQFYFVMSGNPSGNYLTAILNCLYGCLFPRYVYYCRLPASLSLQNYSFNKHVSLVTFGDDNIMGVSDSVKWFFNPTALTEGAASIGMEYTSADKSGPNVAFKTLDKASFLKRGFVWDEQETLWLAPLELDSILEIPNWCWEGATDRQKADSCEQAIRELAMYPKEVWDKWANLINEEAVAVGYPGLFMATWRDYRRSMLRCHDVSCGSLVPCI